MPGFPSERHQNLLHHPRLSLHTGAFCNPHTRRHWESTLGILSLFMSTFPCVPCVCVCIMLSPHVLCVYMHVTWVVCVSARSLSSGVPNWLWHICGFSRRIRAGAKLPRNQCNRLRSPPPITFPPLPLPKSAPPPLLSLLLSVSPLSFFSPSVLLRALIKNGVSVCCIFKMVMDGFKRLMVFSVSSGSCYEPLSWLLWLEPDWLVSTH